MRLAGRCTLFSLPLVLAAAAAGARQSPSPSPNAIVYATAAFPEGRASAVEVDAAGRVYFAGTICAPLLPVTSGAAQSTYGGNCDGFVAALGPDRRLVFATYLGGRGQERISGLAHDASGNVYVVGDTASPDFPATPGAFDETCGPTGACTAPVPGGESGGLDAFAAKLSPTGALVYATFLGGTELDLGLAIGVDSAGRAHVGGYTFSTDFPVTAGAYNGTFGGGSTDAFYARLSPSGDALTYATYVGGGGDEHVQTILVDEAGAAYLGGTTDSFNLDTVAAAQPASGGGSHDGWLMKVSAANTVNYLTYLGGNAADTLWDLARVPGFVYLVGTTCSTDFPGTPAAAPGTCPGSFVARITESGSAVERATTVGGASLHAIGADGAGRVFAAGNPNLFTSSPAFAPTADALQPAPGRDAAVFVALSFAGASRDVTYATYFGGPEARPLSVRSDGSGGAFVGGQLVGTTTTAAIVNAPYSSESHSSFVVHFVPESVMRDNVPGEIVLYAEDATAIVGNWRLEADLSAAGGRRVTNPNAGAARVASPLGSPASYVELTFQVEGGVDYHLWIRGRAANDHWANDSVFVQFSDSVTAAGAATWRIGSTSATTVNLEDCANCGVRGWGWQDNGYGAGVLGPPVRFAGSGTHTLRIQPREDGLSIDQIVLSRSRFAVTAPGGLKLASTVLPRSTGVAAPAGRPEIVLHTGAARLHGAWVREARADAASGTLVRHPDTSAARLTRVAVPPVDYVELTFQADAGRQYRLWIRGRAERDHWSNDSVFVQFSGAVNASGAPLYRIGTNAAAEVNLEDCVGCGVRGWGWQDNGYGAGVLGPLVSFAATGPQTIRISTREDGFAIDQIVLSSAQYLASAPGALRNDTTILPPR